MKIERLACSRRALSLLALAGAAFLTGCGDFWQAPSTTGTTASTTTLTASPTTAVVGESVTLTATVTPSAATGTVTFYNGTTSLGSATLSSGTATLSYSFTAAGSPSVTASYSGDSTYATSTSSAVTVTVTAAGTTASTTTLTATPNPVATGANVTLTATVAPASGTGTPGGTVTFYNGTTSLGSATLSSGTATLSPAPTFSAAGTDSLTAEYSGDSTYAASSSKAVSLTVTSVGTGSSTTTLTVSPSSPVDVGTSVTLTATVTQASGSTTPTGTVTFSDAAGTLGSAVTLNSAGVATYSTTSLTAGSYTFTAAYGGDSNFAAGASNTLNFTVNSGGGSPPAGTECGYQDSANSISSTALDAFSVGQITLSDADSTITVATGSENESAVCAEGSGTELTVTSPDIVSSSAGTNSADSSFYGTDAAVLAYGSSATSASGGAIDMSGGSITTTGQYGSGVFASGDGAAISLDGTDITTTAANAYGAAAAQGGTVTVSSGAFNVNNAEAVVVEGAGAVTLNGTTLNSSLGNNRGILLYQATSGAAASVTSAFTMTNGSIKYTCDATRTEACANGSTSSGQSNPATVFAVANTTATISLTDVTVTNKTPTATDSQGTLLTAAALNSGTWGTAGSNGGNVTFTAYGETLTGDVIVYVNSAVALTLKADTATPAVPSTLTGAINHANSGSKTVSLTLDSASTWIVTATSYLTALNGLEINGTTITNINGGGHCVYYSGTINGASSTTQYTLGGSSGGTLAPAGTTGLTCN